MHTVPNSGMHHPTTPCLQVIHVMWAYQMKSTPDADIHDEVNENQEKIAETSVENKDNEGEETKEYSNEKSHDIEQQDESLPPIDWSWKGYLAWYLHGCMAPKSKRLAIFDPSMHTDLVAMLFLRNYH